MKVYICHTDPEAAIDLALKLEDLGYEPLHDWTNEAVGEQTVADLVAASHRRAVENLDQLRAADLAILLNEQTIVTSPATTQEVPADTTGETAVVNIPAQTLSTHLPSSSVQNFEAGYITSRGKPLVLVGAREHIYHHLTSVFGFDTEANMLTWLCATFRP